MNKQDFYIGWQSEAPDSYAKHIKRFLVLLSVIVVFCAVVLAYKQKEFGTGNFEFGRLTQVTGTYSAIPVPSLVVAGEKDLFGNRSQITIPLIGFGKFGADGVMKEIEREAGTPIEQTVLTLKGTLLYNEGKLLMQVNAADRPLVKMSKNPGNAVTPIQRELGTLSVKGEIVDPKCYFGVMKPGQGKPHKDCAIRCILGGIPPVLRVEDESGNTSYYLIAGPEGERLNKELQNFVAEPVKLTARAVQYNDWVVLYTHPSEIQSISGRELVYKGSEAISCVTALRK